MTKKRNHITLGNSALQTKIHEILMPTEVIEQLVEQLCSWSFIYKETQEESEYRERKQRYNKELLKKVKKIRFTDRQNDILYLMYKKGLTLTETAKILNLKTNAVNNIRNSLFKKIKKYIKYNFEESL